MYCVIAKIEFDALRHQMQIFDSLVQTILRNRLIVDDERNAVYFDGRSSDGPSCIEVSDGGVLQRWSETHPPQQSDSDVSDAAFLLNVGLSLVLGLSGGKAEGISDRIPLAFVFVV